MKKILLALSLCFIAIVGIVTVGCGDNNSNGSEIVEPVDPAPEEPAPEEPKEEVDFTEVIKDLKNFLDGSFVFAEEYESEILSDKAYLRVNADDALPAEDIKPELATFSVEGFKFDCYEEEGKIVFAILVQ